MSTGLFKTLQGPLGWGLDSTVATIDVDHENSEQITLDFDLDGNANNPVQTVFDFKNGDLYLESWGSSSRIDRNFIFSGSATNKTIKVISQPNFGGVEKVIVGGDADTAAVLDLEGFFEPMSDLEKIKLIAANPDPSSTISSNDLSGVKIYETKTDNQGKRSPDFGFTLPISNFDSTIQEIESSDGGTGLTGDLSTIPDGQYPNLNRFAIFGDKSDAVGTLQDTLRVAPSLNTLVFKQTSFCTSGSVTDLAESDGSLNTFRILIQSFEIEGTFSDFASGGVPKDVFHEYYKQRRLHGEFGNMPAQMRGFDQKESLGGDTNSDVITFDAFSFDNYNDISTLVFQKPFCELGEDTARAYQARCANSASSAQAYTSDLYWEVQGDPDGDTNRLYQWKPLQQPHRALSVKPDITTNLTGSVDTSGWNSNWAVAGGVLYEDSSGSSSSGHITVDKPTADGQADTKTDDGNPVPTDSTLPNANGGSGALLHIFEDDNNESGPNLQANSATEYIIDGVVADQNGTDTLTFTLDTGSGPSISDPSSGDRDADTRIAVTW